MSHVVDIGLRMDDDPEVLAAVAKRLGGQLCVGHQSYAWFGRHVGDYPLPEGFKAEDLGKCVHSISFPGIRYELGLAQSPDGNGLTPLFDFWGPGQPLKEKLGGEHAPKLKQLYAIERARKEARQSGYDVEEITHPDGSIEILMVKKSLRQQYASQWKRTVAKVKQAIGVTS